MKLKLIAAALLASLPMVGHANTSLLGVGLGYSDITDSDVNYKQSLTGSLFGIGLFDNGLGYELGLTKFIKYDNKDVDTELEVTVFEVSAYYQHPLNSRTSLFFKGGVAVWDSKVVVSGDTSDDNDSDTDPTLGFGVNLKLHPKNDAITRFSAQYYSGMAHTDHLQFRADLLFPF